MKNFLGSIILLSISLSSCQTSSVSNHPFDISDFKEIKGSQILEYATLTYPQDIVAIDSGVLIQDKKDSHLLQYYRNTHDSSPQHIAKKGLGPNEFINTRNKYYNPINHQLFIYDSQLKQATIYNVNPNGISTDSVRTKVIKFENIHAYETMPLDSCIITTGVFSEKPFALLSPDGTMQNSFGSFPENSTGIENPIAFMLKYQSNIIANPQGTRMVCASPICDWLSFYDMQKGNPHLIKSYNSTEPNVKTYKSNETTTSIKYEPDCVYTYTHLASTENFVYILYDGRTKKEKDDDYFESKKILKFNWEGELINGYEIKEKIYCFSVTNDDRKIIGLINTGDDNIIIKEYNIAD